jgi:hypothetical protein
MVGPRSETAILRVWIGRGGPILKVVSRRRRFSQVVVRIGVTGNFYKGKDAGSRPTPLLARAPLCLACSLYSTVLPAYRSYRRWYRLLMRGSSSSRWIKLPASVKPFFSPHPSLAFQYDRLEDNAVHAIFLLVRRSNSSHLSLTFGVVKRRDPRCWRSLTSRIKPRASPASTPANTTRHHCAEETPIVRIRK